MKDSQILQTAVRFRRLIHQWPELGGHEHKTTALVAKTLSTAKIPFQRPIPTGIVARLAGKSSNPTIVLRADMDALPLTEIGSLPFRSRVPGVMHACGHDAHTAMLLTAALLFKKKQEKLDGSLRLLFQPDEEGSGGARRLVQAGALSSPTVNAVFGLHVNPRLPAGTLGVRPGPLMAAVDRFTLVVRGEGGHGAYPHEGKDAVVLAAEIVMALQTLVSRRVDPVDAAVLTVGTVHGGERFNILPSHVTLTGTVRTLTHETHRAMPRWIQQVAAGIARAHGGRIELRYETLCRPVINNSRMADLARCAAEEVVGSRRVVALDRPSMGGEDFSEYLAQVPGCFVYVGTGASAATRRPWHHPSFQLHEPSMRVGVRFYEALVERAFSELA